MGTLNYNIFTLVLIPSAIFRFAVFAPYGYYWAFANNHYNVIKSHVELYNGTYDPLIETGEKIAAKWGTFGFYWNFAVWIPTFWFPPPLNLPIAVIDSTITVYLSQATHYQTGYAPHSKAACNPTHNGNFSSMLHPPGTNESFYQAAARLNATTTTPVAMCESFAKEWQYGIALSFFYAAISLLNILAFFGSLTKAKESGKTAKEMTVSVVQGFIICVKNAPKAFLLILAALLYFLPEFLFRCLPLSWKAPVRYSRRTALKTALGAEQRTEMKMSELKTEIKNRKCEKRRYAGGDGETSKLAEFLSIYDMLITVTEQLHYLDIISLSRVSKSVREAVLPAEDFDRRMNVFHMYTCDWDDKTTCWTCSTQVCVGCAYYPQIRQTTLLHHVECCEPYCSPCYHAHLHKWVPRSRRLKNPYCACAPVPAKPPTFLHQYINGSSFYQSRQLRLETRARAVCRECNVYSTAELLELREEKTKLQLKQGQQVTDEKWTVCMGQNGACGKDLGTGPRWWICKNANCGKECKSWVHEAWGKKDDEEDDKKAVVGEQAV